MIHCHVCYFAGIIGYFYKKLYGTRYIITEHMSYLADYAQKKYNYVLLKKAYGEAEAVVCVSRYIADNIRSLGFQFNERIIGNVVDTAVFNKNGKKYFSDDSINIAFIGSMGNDEVKGIGYLLKAMAMVLEANGNVRLHLIGDGPKRKEYEELAASLGIDGQCIFYGRMDKAHVAEMLRSCSFFVLPSKHETFGTVIIEALSCGKPVVTTDTGAQKEIISDISLGYVVHSQDVDSLFEGLNFMINNYSKYDAEHLKNAAAEYSYQSIAGKVYSLYEQILQNDGDIK
jgi:glycosyltransferase involved in cell wall biosynthesis